MNAIGKGDWVQFIDPADYSYFGLRFDGVYCIEDPGA